MMMELPLALRVSESDAVFEGKVLGSHFESLNGNIYTIYSVEVFKVFKGDVTTNTVEIAAPGGYLNGKIHVIEPNFHGTSGQIGLFTVNYKPELGGDAKQARFYPFAADQSVITYHQEEGFASDHFHKYTDLENEVYQPIQQHLHTTVKIVKSFDASEFIAPKKFEDVQQATATIDYITPLSVRGGVGDTLIIYGIGFGGYGGSRAKVEFRNADDGGQTWITPPSNHIIKWANNEIQVKVPGGNWFTLTDGYNGAAGSGQIRVTPESGQTVISSQSITVRHSINARTYQTNQTTPAVFETFFPYLIDNNDLGGYTFRPSNAYKANNPAVEVFKRSLQTWRCGTGVNFSYSERVSTANCAKEDNICTIAMSSAGCPMPFQGVLAYTSSLWANQPCVGHDEKSYFTITEIDLVVNKDVNWNYTTDTIKNGKMDLQSVLTHELGHAHQLGHVIDDKKIMHYAIGPNVFARKLNVTSDIVGGNEVLDTSMVLRCSAVNKTYRVNQGECSISHPKVMFSVDADEMLQGCAPLTVKFKNLTVNTPENYLWDIDGDDKNDEFVENPTKVFTKPGKYSVRLVAWRGDQRDTLIRKDYITVYNSPAVATIPVYSICKDSTVIIGGKDIVTGGIQPYTYSWSPNVGIVSGRFTNTPSVKPTETTRYIISVRDGNGCLGYDTVTVSVVENIKPKINRKGDTLYITETGAYQWLIDGVVIPEAKTNTYVPNKSGNYSVKLINTAGCSSVSDAVPFTISSVLDNSSNNEFVLSFDEKNNTLTLNGVLNNTVELYSMMGVLLEKNICTHEPSIITMSSYSSGVYFVRITANNKSFVYSFTKH